jgi:Malectin domain
MGTAGNCNKACSIDIAAYLWSFVDSSSSNSSNRLSFSSSSSVGVGDEFVVLYAVNSGGPAFTAADGTRFTGDLYFSEGNIGSTTDPIANTVDDTLYQSERRGLFSYNFPVDTGTYDVTVHMVEGWYGPQPGNRVFDVEVEGNVLINDFYPLTAGHDVAHAVELKGVEVTDGQLTMNFTASVGEANVAAIVIKGLKGKDTGGR